MNLSKPVNRAKLLLPPCVLCIIGMLYASGHIIFAWKVTSPFVWFYMLSSVWLLFVLIVITMYDFKAIDKRFKKI